MLRFSLVVYLPPRWLRYHRFPPLFFPESFYRTIPFLKNMRLARDALTKRHGMFVVLMQNRKAFRDLRIN